MNDEQEKKPLSAAEAEALAERELKRIGAKGLSAFLNSLDPDDTPAPPPTPTKESQLTEDQRSAMGEFFKKKELPTGEKILEFSTDLFMAQCNAKCDRATVYRQICKAMTNVDIDRKNSECDAKLAKIAKTFGLNRNPIEVAIERLEDDEKDIAEGLRRPYAITDRTLLQSLLSVPMQQSFECRVKSAPKFAFVGIIYLRRAGEKAKLLDTLQKVILAGAVAARHLKSDSYQNWREAEITFLHLARYDRTGEFLKGDSFVGAWTVKDMDALFGKIERAYDELFVDAIVLGYDELKKGGRHD